MGRGDAGGEPLRVNQPAQLDIERIARAVAKVQHVSVTQRCALKPDAIDAGVAHVAEVGEHVEVGEGVRQLDHGLNLVSTGDVEVALLAAAYEEVRP